MIQKSEILDVLRREMNPKNPEQSWILDNLLCLHVAGSGLYGTATAESDLDIRGVTLSPKSYWVGARRFEQREEKIPELGIDVVIYDVRRWLHLAIAVNPNVVETLYVPIGSDALICVAPAWWEQIVPTMKSLISQRAHVGYHGYATSQLKKMVTKQSNKTGRREIADKHGFDTKFAAHGFRLVAQGAELLRTGNITFPRPDAEQLRAIRDGKVYGPDEAEQCVADWEVAASDLDLALKESVLPAQANFEVYDRLLVSIYDELVAGAERNGTTY